MIGERGYRTVVCGYLAMCILLGGASAAGILANLALQIGAIMLGALALVRLIGTGLDDRHRAMLAVAAGIMVLPLLQLIPMAPDLWRSLPARDTVADGFDALDIPLPWLPLSLDAGATLASWLALLPAMALLLAVMTLEPEHRVWIGWTVLAVAIVSSLLAIAQYASRSFYLYEITNIGHGVGFFANRNHLATLLLVALPTLTLQFPKAGKRPPIQTPGWSSHDFLSSGLLAILLIGLLAAGSRAGLGLAIPVLITSIGLRMRAHSGESPVRLIIAAAVLCAVILAAVVFGPWMTRFAAKMGEFTEEETRLVATRVTADAGWDVFPFGTGFGSFDSVFRLVGGEANLGANYINHAHNDYIELWLTGGLPAVLMLLAFLWWFVGAVRSGWRPRADNAGAVPRVAAVTVAVVLIHSLVDYPLRTAAISAIFAVSCGLLLEPALPRRRRARGPTPYGHAKPAVSPATSFALIPVTRPRT
ncbi:O-antigen ligase family protein [Polymorphobacter sp.]|uniref:O-antigen ligase family protein n=1 Tax=Polymorphobacter sp. TaxID=1909290 RepID=UPI003F71C3B1